MTYFHDLSPNSYFGQWEDILLSVGWLDSAHDYPRGTVTPAFFRALVQLLVDPWQPGALAGFHRCSFCPFTGGPGSLVFEDRTIVLGSANLFVPGPAGKVYVAPSLIAHVIDAHGYAPPEEFQRAVLECPTMRTMPYLKALRERGLGVRLISAT